MFTNKHKVKFRKNLSTVSLESLNVGAHLERGKTSKRSGEMAKEVVNKHVQFTSLTD